MSLTWSELENTDTFVHHCIEEHLMTAETWFNIPTTRGYHDFLHRTGGQSHGHGGRDARA